MERLLEFAGNHPLLSAGIAATVIAIIAHEIYQLKIGGRAVDTATATRLYNKENAVFIDVRGENAYVTSHLPGAVNVPGERIAQQGKRLARHKGRPAIVYGEPGRGVGKAIAALRESGFDTVYELRGGFAAWQEASLPVEGRS